MLSASEPLWAALCASLMLHQSLAPSELVGGALVVGPWGWKVDPKNWEKLGRKYRDFKNVPSRWNNIEDFEAGEMGQVPAKSDLVNHKEQQTKKSRKNV